MSKLSVRAAPAASPSPPTFAAKAPGKGPSMTFPVAGPKKKKRSISFGRPINAKGQAVFTRQLATLVKAGMPIMRSLEVLARQEKRPAFKAVIEDCADTIRSGGNFSDGLAANPKAFDRLYVNMVKAGEIRGKVVAAMVYPAIISLVAGGIMAILMVWVVPKFQEVFFTMLKGKPLPWLTAVVVGIADALRKNLLIVLGGMTGVFVLF